MSSRQFAEHARNGVELEGGWDAALKSYEEKYPKEAQEFKQLIGGSIPSDWDKALPVLISTFS